MRRLLIIDLAAIKHGLRVCDGVRTNNMRGAAKKLLSAQTQPTIFVRQRFGLQKKRRVQIEFLSLAYYLH